MWRRWLLACAALAQGYAPARPAPRRAPARALRAAAAAAAPTAEPPLVSVMVVQKSDYRWFWYVLAFFSALPALCELAAILSVVMLKKRRW